MPYFGGVYAVFSVKSLYSTELPENFPHTTPSFNGVVLGHFFVANVGGGGCQVYFRFGIAIGPAPHRVS